MWCAGIANAGDHAATTLAHGSDVQIESANHTGSKRGLTSGAGAACSSDTENSSGMDWNPKNPNLLAGLHEDEVAKADVAAVDALGLPAGDGGPVGGLRQPPGGEGPVLQGRHAALCTARHAVLDRVAHVEQHQQPRPLRACAPHLPELRALGPLQARGMSPPSRCPSNDSGWVHHIWILSTSDGDLSPSTYLMLAPAEAKDLGIYALLLPERSKTLWQKESITKYANRTASDEEGETMVQSDGVVCRAAFRGWDSLVLSGAQRSSGA